MINKRLSTREAAERLGVKPATLYSYVSRGLLHPVRGPSGSSYDVDEVVRLSRSARRPSGRVPSSRQSGDRSRSEPLFVTELTLIDNDRLYYRGLDAVTLATSKRFEEVAGWLWDGSWPARRDVWRVPEGFVSAVQRTNLSVPTSVAPVERFGPALMAASLSDDLRHDLSPSGVPLTGRSILAVMATALPFNKGAVPADDRMSARVWKGLTGRGPSWAGLRALESALVLAADHELAPSTLAARVAASFRADPYAVVMTALGPASGGWQSGSTGAPTEVEQLLAEAAEMGPERAIGENLKRRGEVPHGFGMPLYPHGDPRAAALLDQLEGVGTRRRVDLVRRVVSVGAARGFAPPNFDLGLAALSYCAGMVPGAAQAIFTLAKAVGWLAHAMEEYDHPTVFRMRADYVGSRPEDSPAS